MGLRGGKLDGEGVRLMLWTLVEEGVAGVAVAEVGVGRDERGVVLVGDVEAAGRGGAMVVVQSQGRSDGWLKL